MTQQSMVYSNTEWIFIDPAKYGIFQYRVDVIDPAKYVIFPYRVDVIDPAKYGIFQYRVDVT